jgi:tetratricopeptide (TPR) repeat protein
LPYSGNGGKMHKLSGIKYVAIVLVGIIIMGCVPSQTVEKTDTEKIEINPELALQEYSIAFEYYKQGKYDDAIDHFKESIKADPKYYAAYIALAKAYRIKRDIITAESTYNQAKNIDLSDPRAYEGLATIYFIDYKNYDKAITEFQNGLKVDTTNIDLLNGLAACYTKKKEYDTALEYYRKSLEYDPENIETMFAIAKVYMEKDEPDKAVHYLEDLVVKKPKNIEVRKKLAETLVNLKRYNKAVEQYKYLIEKEPDNYYYHIQLGKVYQQQKKYTDAQKEFEEARTLAPDNALPIFRLADLKIIQGKFSAAENLIKEAKKLAPDNLYAEFLLGDIYERRGYRLKTAWDKNKSKKNCSKLDSAISNLSTAISYYSKATADDTFRSYAKNGITRCSNWMKTLKEDKWFYCKGKE